MCNLDKLKDYEGIPLVKDQPDKPEHTFKVGDAWESAYQQKADMEAIYRQKETEAIAKQKDAAKKVAAKIGALWSDRWEEDYKKTMAEALANAHTQAEPE